MRGYAVKKQFLELGGAPVLEWSLRAFFSSDIIREVVLVAAPGDEVCCEQNFTRLRSGKRFLIVTGGETRQSSVEAGARAVGDDCEYIAVHDGARPFAGGALIRACSEAAARTGAACAAVRVTDTIKSAAGRYVAETPDRSILWAAQTPQTFRRAVLLNALDAARRDGFTATDDVSLVERLGCRVEIVESSYDNIKITTPADYAAALAIAARLTAR
jgi:2-C-methyl-D-erythritol 4-phosphate cytidylyltransferase